MLSKIVFIYFIIFVFLFFVPFVICDDCEDNTTPSNRYDCLKLSSSNKLCCYDGNSCKSINDLKDNTNNYDCGIVKGSVGEYEFSIYHPIPSDDIGIGFQTCGAKKPKKKKDCTNYSQLTNSCCYFENKDDNKKKHKKLFNIIFKNFPLHSYLISTPFIDALISSFGPEYFFPIE